MQWIFGYTSVIIVLIWVKKALRFENPYEAKKHTINSDKVQPLTNWISFENIFFCSFELDDVVGQIFNSSAQLFIIWLSTWTMYSKCQLDTLSSTSTVFSSYVNLEFFPTYHVHSSFNS